MMYGGTETSRLSQNLLTYRPAEVEFFAHVVRGYTFEQILQPIDSTQVGFQHVRSFSIRRASANIMSPYVHETAIPE